MSLFHIYIVDAGAGQYRVSAQSPDGAAETITYRPEVEPYASFAELAKRLYERQPGFGFPTFLTHEEACNNIGKSLFEYFFTGQVLKAFRDYSRNAPQVRLALHLPRTRLYSLPWELLRDNAEGSPYSSFFAKTGSVVRFDSDSSIRPDTMFPLPVPPVSVVQIFPNIPGWPAVGSFQLEDGDRLRYLPAEPATFDRLQSAFSSVQPKPQGFTFFGHGRSEQDRGTLLFLREEKRFLRATTFREEARGGDVLSDALGDLSLACLFACESAWVSDQIEFRNTVAGSLMDRTRTAFVIGAQTPIDYRAAEACFLRLLQCLDEGEHLDLALGAGRRAVLTLAGEGEDYIRRDWWVPVLYARTSSLQLLPLPADRRTPPPPVSPERRIPDSEAAEVPIDFRAGVHALGRVLREAIIGDAGKDPFAGR